MGDYTIRREVLPIVGGLGGHYYLALYDNNNKLIGEMHGLATSTSGEIKPVGFSLLGDEVKVYQYSSGTSIFYPQGGLSGYWLPSNPGEVVFSGTMEEVNAKWIDATLAGQAINGKDIFYEWTGGADGDLSSGNSNSVNKTLLDAMGLPAPQIGNFTPGDEKNLLHPEENPVSGKPDNGTDDFPYGGQSSVPRKPFPWEEWSPFGKQCRLPSDPFGKWFGLDRDGRFRIAWFDPLTLDLDGDGIETVGTNGWSGSLFDMNNDGIRTATGWIKSDDGLLVFDRNGNGIVDNGTELFGDHTPISSGGFAQHGFAALADLDSNHDGKIDARDADFAYLKVWRDLNQDGVSSANELFTLSQLGIASLNLAYTNTNQALTGGNVLAQVGSYTLTNGTVRQMGDVNLAADMLHTEYTDHIALTPEQAVQPNIQGMDRLRDLRERLSEVVGYLKNLKTVSSANYKYSSLKILFLV